MNDYYDEIHWTRRRKPRYHLVRKVKALVPEVGMRYASFGFLLLKDGVLHMDIGYAWDGPTGLVFHSDKWVRGSLVHDALCDLVRFAGGSLTRGDLGAIHRIMRRIFLEDGVWPPLAWAAWALVAAAGNLFVRYE